MAFIWKPYSIEEELKKAYLYHPMQALTKHLWVLAGLNELLQNFQNLWAQFDKIIVLWAMVYWQGIGKCYVGLKKTLCWLFQHMYVRISHFWALYLRWFSHFSADWSSFQSYRHRFSYFLHLKANYQLLLCCYNPPRRALFFFVHYLYLIKRKQFWYNITISTDKLHLEGKVSYLNKTNVTYINKHCLYRCYFQIFQS